MYIRYIFKYCVFIITVDHISRSETEKIVRATIDTVYCMVQHGSLMDFMCSNLLWNGLITKTESVLILIYIYKNKTQNQLTSAMGQNKQTKEKIGNFSVSSSS